MGEGADKVILNGSSVEKDLGVYVDDSLSFTTHCHNIISAANRLVGVIRRTFVYMDKRVFGYLYKALIRPRLEYAATVWSPRRVREIDLIEAVQRRATKLVPEIANRSYEELLRYLNLPTLVFRRMRGDIIHVYKFIQGLFDVDCSLMFPLVKESTTRGHPYRIWKRRSKTSSRMHFFSQRVVNEWNSLPYEVVTAPTLNAFKSCLDRHWAQHRLLYDFKAPADVFEY